MKKRSTFFFVFCGWTEAVQVAHPKLPTPTFNGAAFFLLASFSSNRIFFFLHAEGRIVMELYADKTPKTAEV
jgi:hypothetical protein